MEGLVRNPWLRKGEAVKKENEADAVSAVIKTLHKMGYKTTNPRHRNANGPDIFAITDKKAMSVEIKKASTPNNESSVLRVKAVEKNRRADDLIAIVLPCGYVLVEPMRDHLKACNSSGVRFLNY